MLPRLLVVLALSLVLISTVFGSLNEQEKEELKAPTNSATFGATDTIAKKCDEGWSMVRGKCRVKQN
jgi:hypothetical protein